MPVKSLYPEISIPVSVNYWQFVQIMSARYMDRKALIDNKTGETFTYPEFFKAVKAAGNALWKHSMRKGDVMVVFSYNHIGMPIMMLAAVSLGAIYSGCNPLYTAKELSEQLKECHASFVVTVKEFLPKIKEAQKTYKTLKEIILLDAPQEGCLFFRDLLKPSTTTVPPVNINPREDIAWIMFSSGTTGKSKGVMITHYNLVSNQMQMLNTRWGYDAYTEEGAFLMYLPFYFIGGSALASNFLFLQGRTLVIMDKFDFKELLEGVQRYKVKSIICIPPVLLLMVKSPIVDQHNLSSLRIVVSGAAPISKDLEMELRKKLKIPTKQLYGMTEGTAFITSAPHDEEYPVGTVGKLIPNIKAKILHTVSKKELGPNMEGEIFIRGPNVMKGYLNNPKATADCIDKDGWLNTGDVGYYDEAGYFFITDRSKDIIKYKSMQVAPASLEAELLVHESVADAAVIGVPDRYAGELPRAYIVLKDGHTATEKEIQKYIEGRLAPHKWLRGGVEFVKAIPKSPSGKILRRIIKDEMMANLKSAVKSKM